MGRIIEKANQAYRSLKAKQEAEERQRQSSRMDRLAREVESAFNAAGHIDQEAGVLVVDDLGFPLRFRYDEADHITVEVTCPKCGKPIFAIAGSFAELGTALNEPPTHDVCEAPPKVF